MSELPRQHGPWTIREQREVYRDPWVNVRRDEVIRPDGESGSYCVVNVKAGVTVLAIDDQDRVWLTEEFHYGVGRVTIECVSGGVEAGEEMLAGAKRELQEELGIEADEWTDVGMVDPFTANVVSPTQLFIAKKLRFSVASPDGAEVIKPYVVPFPVAIDAVMQGDITHGPSCVAILKAALLRGS